MGSAYVCKTPIHFDAFYEILGMLWGILRHVMAFKLIWNVRECSEGLSDVLRCSDVIQGVIVGYELVWNVPESFLGIVCPICFDQVIKIPDVSKAFFDIQ